MENSTNGESTVESSSVNKKMYKQKHIGSSRQNLGDLKGKAASYFGFKKSKKSESPEPFRGQEQGEKDRQVGELKAIYTNKEYGRCVQEGVGLLRSQPKLAKNTSLLFYLAMSHFKLEQHKEARKNFEAIIALDAAYKKSVYLFLAISLKKEEQYDSAIEVLSKCGELYPNFSEAKVPLSYPDIHGPHLHKEEAVPRSHRSVRAGAVPGLTQQGPCIHGPR